jgi:hypothetical protein
VQNVWSKRYRQSAGAWDPDFQVASSPADDFQQTAIKDPAGNLWLFWMSLRDAARPTIWLRRFNRTIDAWEANPASALITSAAPDQLPSAGVDSTNTVFLLWQSSRDGGDDRLFWKRFDNTATPIGVDARLAPGGTNTERSPAVLVDSRDGVWAFWRERMAGFFQIRTATFSRTTSTWTVQAALTSGNSNKFDPIPVEDSQGNIWVFWRTAQAGGELLLYRIFNTATGNWSQERAVTNTPGDYTLMGAFRASDGGIWVAWTETVGTTSQAYVRQFFPVI